MATDNLHISQLQQKISVGDERALKELHGLISEGLFQLSVSIVRSTQLAEEVVEDVFIKCWEQGTQLASIRNLKAYLYVLTRNISLDYLRRVSGKKRYRLEEVSVPLLLVEATPEDILISAELIKKINAIINDLPPRCKLIPLKGSWKVSFDTAWGGPGMVTFDKLISWPQSKQKEIRFYSGTAVYRKQFQLNAGDLGHQHRIILDLGTLYNLAEVIINRKSAGALCKDPFSCDITPNVKSGINKLEIKVVNLWPNRIIGDQSLPPARRYTHTNVIKFKAGYPLLPSGLLGPVVIRFRPVISL
jgi:RNA polymerase sigma factor (sigma-70 family)